MSHKTIIRFVALSLVLILLLGSGVYYAPRFFAYADEPAPSDAIILFVGPDFTAREKEAHRLLDEGYARFLIVPTFQKVFTAANIPPQIPNGSDHANFRGFKTYPRFYENTHIEILHARQTMNAMELRSAIMVSSPHHMRRIAMISEKVFGDESLFFSYVPARHERSPAGIREMRLADWKLVIQESIKICWFQVYSFVISSHQ